MASNGSFNTNGKGGLDVGTPYIEFSWSVSNTDVSNNKHTIYYKAVGKGLVSGYYCALHKFQLIIDGVERYNTNDRGINVYNDTVIAEGYADIYHNPDGSRDFNAEIHAGYYDYNIENVSGSGSWSLDNIPRYTTVSISQKSKDINSISVNWNSTDARDFTQYKIKKGNGAYSDWKDANDIVASNNKSGYFAISNLEPNTKYSVIVQVKRTDSQLWSSSGEISITTYDYAKFSSVSSSNFGENVSISKNNESGLSNTLQVYVGNTLIASRTSISNIYTLILTQSELDALYKKYSISSSSVSIIYKVLTTCNSTQYTDSITKTMNLKGNAKILKIKQNSSIKRAKVFIKQNGTIKRAVVFIKQNSFIKRCI